MKFVVGPISIAKAAEEKMFFDSKLKHVEHLAIFARLYIDASKRVWYVTWAAQSARKKQRKQIRGYLVYIEGVSPDACDRIVEIFNEINTAYVKNAEGQFEHPFKGISRNPVPVRERTIMPQLGAWGEDLPSQTWSHCLL